MTPKEKAKELIKRFTEPIDELHKYPMRFDTAKQCALICVDEIQEHAQMVKGEYEGYANAWNYFNVVKKEIKKLC